MRKYCHSLFVLLLFGLFSFSEGKPCPERTRPHKSRCDLYYKCTELTADKHVWVPNRCEEGLVYEHSLTVCVLPADDWECLMGENKSKADLNGNSEQQRTNSTSNRDADVYIVTNAEDDDDTNSNSKYDDDKVEIIIGPDVSSEDKDAEAEDGLYDGSGNGGELVELDGFMPAQNREDELDDIPVLATNEKTNENLDKEQIEPKIEQKVELDKMLETIKTKAEIGQPSTNIDPKLNAHLQRLSQLIDGLKQTYQMPAGVEVHDQLNLRPDQLNAFLAHFNIKNKFASLDPNDGLAEVSRPNRTLHYKNYLNAKLNPETKVVLSHTIPHYYGSGKYDNGNSGGGYSNSQIVVNRPEGSVHFRLPEHHYVEHPEYSAENTPKISEETLKTVLELSKQMIAQQNVPKIIPSPTYFAPPIMQPILLTPHIDSPFSTNYVSQNSNSLDYSGYYSNAGAYGQNYKSKKKGKRPHHSVQNSNYDGDDDGNYDTSANNNNSNNNKPGTTIIHNNVIPVHVSGASSGEKEVLDSYGQSLGIYPPLHEETATNPNADYQSNSNLNTGYSSNLQSNKYLTSTTKRPSYVSISLNSSPYGTTSKPFEFQPTKSTVDQYFTPSEHLSNHNVNSVFSSVDNYGSIPRPMKGKNPGMQNYNALQEITENDTQDHTFPQVDNNKVHIRPNSQNYEATESENEDLSYNYQDDNNNDDESELIAYTYGNKNQPDQQSQFSNYGNSGSQASSTNTVFSTNNPYLSRPHTNKQYLMPSANSYYSPSKNKYTPISSPISTTYGEGGQLVNVGGNFISFDVFQNSILPLLGNNPAALQSSLQNVEVITCSAGVRQPNITDCTRYYVCSKKDGKVLSYSCPPYTAFNSNARICDAKTYAICNDEPIIQTYSVSENKRIQMEALKAQQETKRRRQQLQAIKAQNMVNLLQHYNPSSTSLSLNNPLTTAQDSSEQNMLSSYMQQAASMSQSFGTTPTPRPPSTTPITKKRKYYCKEGDKIADQTSIYNYFVCYKNAKGQMKGHKMTCSKGLQFCPKTTMCTLPSKCSL